MYAINITSIKAKIMFICLGLEQALKITIITDTIYRAQKMFNILLHPYKTLVIPIIEKIYNFFAKSPDNIITIWYCPTSLKWKLHKDVDNDVKSSRITPTFPSKKSWDYSRKSKCNDLLNYWKMSFQVSDRKRCNFLDLDDDNKGKPIKPYYKKGRA